MEKIYYSHPDDGSYSFFIHYFAENSGVNSVDYTVSLSSYGETEEYSGTISGQGSIVHIHTVLIGGKTNASLMSIEVEDLNNLPAKSIIE